jgi:hypothetical protein
MDQDEDGKEEQENIHVCLFNVIKEHALSCQTRPLANVSVTWSILHYLSVKFSSYGLTGIYDYLQNPDIFTGVPEDNWIVCPIQLDKDTGGWDIQIGMSGKSKEGQTPFDGMRLELQEELGLQYIPEQEVSGTFILPPRTLFFVKIVDTMSMDEKSTIVISENDSDSTNRLSCFVHGTLPELFSVIDREEKQRTYLCNEDNILGLALVSIKTIKKIIREFNNGKGKGKGVGSGKGKGKGKGVGRFDFDTGGKGVGSVDFDTGGKGVGSVDFDTGGKGVGRVDFDTILGKGVGRVDFDTGGKGVGRVDFDTGGKGVGRVDFDTILGKGKGKGKGIG